MTTFAVTVTYGNRSHLLKQALDSALAEGVARVYNTPQKLDNVLRYMYDVNKKERTNE